MIPLRCPRPSMARCSDWTSRRPWWITCWAVATTTCTSTSTMADSAPRRAPLMTLDEVLERLLSAAAPHRIPDTETLPTTAALGRVLGEDIVSPLDVPPADNSSMDGYALRVADLVAPGTVLPVSQRIAAGHVGEPLAAGTAARIFTGAQLPAGADAVVMQELCEAVDGGVRIQACAEPAWRCSPPVTNSSCRASRCALARSTTPTATPCAACSRRPVARCRTWASCPTAWTPPARPCAAPRPVPT